MPRRDAKEARQVSRELVQKTENVRVLGDVFAYKVINYTAVVPENYGHTPPLYPHRGVVRRGRSANSDPASCWRVFNETLLWRAVLTPALEPEEAILRFAAERHEIGVGLRENIDLARPHLTETRAHLVVDRLQIRSIGSDESIIWC